MNTPKEFYDMLKAYHTALELYTKEKYVVSVRKLEDPLHQTVNFGGYITQKRIEIYGSQINQFNGEYPSIDVAHSIISTGTYKLSICDTQNVIIDSKGIIYGYYRFI